jgi:hypothetical protein
MIVSLHNSDLEKIAIILLLQKIKIFQPEIGSYIDHFPYNEQDIVIKLTNGYLKVKEYLGDSIDLNNNDISLLELEKFSKTFIKNQF